MRFTRAQETNSPSGSSSSSTVMATPQAQPAVAQPPQTASRSSRRRQRPQRTRYHFNNVEAGLPVNFWGIDRRDVYRTCFCFHVRTVTIFIGVWHLMVYILWLSFIAAMFMYEPTQDGYPSDGGLTARPDILPTPVSKTSGFGDFSNHEVPKSDSLTIDQTNEDARLESLKNSPLNYVMDTKKANSQVVLLMLCHMLITLLMVYGAVRGKPSYLMPFFVLRVFDFCIFCLTMVGYFSYLPSMPERIVNTRSLPFREQLINMDPQLLSLITLIVIVVSIAVKAYIIGVIWNCYKYLMLRNSVIRTVIAYRHDDPSNIMGLQQNLLPDLPDYETAVNDPRYAKKPPIIESTSAANSGNPVSGTASIAMPPPPPYSVAIASEPLNYDLTETTATATNESAPSTIENDEQIQNEAEATVENEPVDNNATITAQDASPSPSTSFQEADTTEVIVEPVSKIIEVAPAPSPSESANQ